MKKTFQTTRCAPLTLGAVIIAMPLIAINKSHAESSVQIYGKANVSLNKVKEQSKSPVVDEWQLNSNASRLGVKGDYAIDDDLKAIYRMEYEVHIDDGESSSSKGSDSFEQRNIYAGIEGGFGRVIAGKHDTPLKLSQGKVDRFSDQMLGDIKNYMEGEDRADNIVMYTSPAMSGFSVTAAIIPAENSTGSSGGDGLSDGTSASLTYNNNWLRATVAQNSDVDKQDTTRLVTEFNMSDTKVGLLWQEAEQVDGSADEDSWLISGAQSLGHGVLLKAQYGKTDYSDNSEDAQWVFGLDKKLNKSTKVFAYYAKIENENNGVSTDDSNAAIGYELKF